ncbi:alpha/beta hydrolase [Roseococcus sp. SYP-B2431]|uniref:alpha/beta hydrolase n=1 Tax=Roseococcus sp. SYP-B2431 TaxID=2496640 RepID=UPI00103E6E41|nr:alpha/beta hydrolase [Roseococcus sp. SYP-B2431]TCH97241.1 alpha/beta hydrolase [Roseococcus sp. SYP-B2431]
MQERSGTLGETPLAYRALAGKEPGVVFLGGFHSDMTGSKAAYLAEWCATRGRAYLRFDYSGHGASGGRFEDGTIGGWLADAAAVLAELTKGPQILIGSSMGGWIALLLALRHPERVAGLIGIAAAPDFTEELMWAQFPQSVRDQIQHEGFWTRPSAYGDGYPITRALIEDGRDHLILGGPITLDRPVRFLHGQDDPDVPWQHSLRLAERITSRDVEVTLIKGGDHRLSTPDNLALLGRTLGALLSENGT